MRLEIDCWELASNNALPGLFDWQTIGLQVVIKNQNPSAWEKECFQSSWGGIGFWQTRQRQQHQSEICPS